MLKYTKIQDTNLRLFFTLVSFKIIDEQVKTIDVQVKTIDMQLKTIDVQMKTINIQVKTIDVQVKTIISWNVNVKDIFLEKQFITKWIWKSSVKDTRKLIKKKDKIKMV